MIKTMIDLLHSNWPAIWTGLVNTLFSSAVALFFSLILGSLFSILETSPNKVWHWLARVYIEIFRNIPLLVITMFFYLVLPKVFIKLNGFTAGTIGLILYTSAFVAETIQSGIRGVGTGQMEGALSNGMSYWQAMRYIILPQAFKIAIPGLGNQFINLIKNSSVLAFVAGFDLMYQADVIAAESYQTIPTYLLVGVLYLVLTLPLSYVMKYLEKRS